MNDGAMEVGGQTEWLETCDASIVGEATAPVAEAGNTPLN